MTVSAEAPAEEDELPAIPMAEDEDTGEVWDDRAGDTIIGDDDADDDGDSAAPTDDEPPQS
jgi:hypothetical protein